MLLGATRPAVANKRGRFDSAFFDFFVLVGVVWWRSFMRGRCQRSGRRGRFSSPFFVFFGASACNWVGELRSLSSPIKGEPFCFFFCFLLYLWVQLSQSSPTNRELGFLVFFFFFLKKFLSVLLGATRPAIANKGAGSAPFYFFLFLFFFITIFLQPPLPPLPTPHPHSCNKKIDIPSNLHFNACLFLSFF